MKTMLPQESRMLLDGVRTARLRARTSVHAMSCSRASFVLVLASLLQTGCSPHTETKARADLLARVGQEVVNEAGYRHWWDEHRPSTDTSEARQAVLDKLVERSALAQAARVAGLDQDPVVVEQIENLLIGRLKETQLQPELKALHISDEEVRADYESNVISKFSVPARVHVAVLWFNTRGQEPLEARYRPRLESARQEAASLPLGEGFGRLAMSNTEDRASRYKGGDIGWLEESPVNNPWKKQVLSIAATLKEPGQFSQVEATDQGLFLVRLMERQAAHVKSFESVRPDIDRRLLSSRRKQTEDQFPRRILAQMSVRQFPDRLRALQGLPVREVPGTLSTPLQLGAR